MPMYFLVYLFIIINDESIKVKLLKSDKQRKSSLSVSIGRGLGLTSIASNEVEVNGVFPRS